MRTFYLATTLLISLYFFCDNSTAQVAARTYNNLPNKQPTLIEPVSNHGVCLAEQNGKYGFVGSDISNVVLPIIYDTILPLRSTKYKNSYDFAVVENGKFGVVHLSYDDSLMHLLQPKYDYIECGTTSVNYHLSTLYAYDGYEEGYDDYREPTIIPRVVKLGDRYGYLDPQLKEMCAFEYEDASSFSSGLAAVKKNGKYGYINAQFEVVIPFKYENAKPFYGNEAVVTINGAEGKINKSDSIVLTPQFDEIRWRNTKFTMFRLGSEWGLLNRKGMIILSPVYEEIGESSWRYISVKRDGKYGLIDMNLQEVITPAYDVPVSPNQLEKCGYAHIVKDSLYGLVNSSFEVVCPPLYDKMDIDIMRYRRGYTPLKKDGKAGLLDEYGRVIVEPRYHSITWLPSIKMYIYENNALAGVLDSAENVVIPARFHSIRQASNTLFEVKYNGMVGRYDLEGNEVLPLKYDWVYHAGDYFQVGLMGKKGVATKQGELIVPLKFEDIWMFRDTFGIAHRGGKWGFINRKGEWTVQPRYDQIKMMRDDEIVVKIDGKCGFVNQKGEETLPIIYDKTVNIHMLYDYGFMRVTLNGKSGIIDTTHKLILPIEYDHLTHAQISKSMRESNCIFLRKGGKIGMLHRSGNVVPCQYDYIRTGHYVPKDVFLVTKGDLMGVVDSTGKVIVPFDSTYIQIGRTSNLDWDGQRHEKEVIFIREQGKYHLIYDKKGKLIIKDQFTWVHTKKDYGSRFTFKNRKGNYYLSPQKRWVKIHYSGKG